MQEENIGIIKKIIYKYLPDSKLILFGSQVKNTVDDNSDYDILVVINQDLNVKTKFKYAHLIRKELAKSKILIDIIIKSSSQIKEYNNNGYIVEEALKEGIQI